MPVITHIEDLRVLAQKRVPRMFSTMPTRAVGLKAPTAPMRAISSASSCASVWR